METPTMRRIPISEVRFGEQYQPEEVIWEESPITWYGYLHSPPVIVHNLYYCNDEVVQNMMKQPAAGWIGMDEFIWLSPQDLSRVNFNLK